MAVPEKSAAEKKAFEEWALKDSKPFPEVNVPAVEMVEVKLIKADGKNPNKMTPGQEKALDENIKKYGFIIPVITNKDLLIADGEHRWNRAKALGMDKVPVIRLPVSEVDRRILRQVLNKLKGSHDFDLDKDEYKFFMEENSFEDLQALLGESDKTLVQFLASVEKDDLGDDSLDIDKSLESPKYKIEKGDVWELGDHRLVCGDSTLSTNVDMLISGEKADMVFTDPPYNVAYGSSKHPSWGKKWNKGGPAILNDELSPEEWKKFIDSWMKLLLESCTGAIYICMSCKEWARIMDSFEENGGHWSSTIIWEKNAFVLSRKDYNTQFEPILNGNETDEEGEPIIYGWKEGEKRTWNGGHKQSDIWRVERNRINDLHPTMKPVDLVKRAIINSSNKGASVLDLFGGSGTTLIACEQLSRACRMMELDPRYCSVIIERWETVTGRKAEKVS